MANPLISAISANLPSAGKLHGSSTPLPSCSVESVAVLRSRKTDLEKEVVAPLHELKHRVANREALLEEMLRENRRQVKALLGHLEGLKSRVAASKDTLGALQEAGKDLELRAGRCLEACEGLAGGVTRAERDYFGRLTRFDRMTIGWAEDVDKLRSEVARGGGSGGGGGSRDEQGKLLDDRQMGMCEDLLAGEGAILVRAKEAAERARANLAV